MAMTAQPALDPRAFRDTMGRFATGVTVMTWDDGVHVRGMTANAVTSVSLDPMLVLVCVDRKTSAHAQMEHASAFALSILAADQVDISMTFARHGVEDMAGVPYGRKQTGTPVIDGAIAWIECEVSERLAGGDHTIYLGQVVAMGIERPDARPLLFYAGRYREIGDELV
jgi:flavin reductase (DIM6/NTAB) family NADH-FMN oxidoreductase RutF